MAHMCLLASGDLRSLMTATLSELKELFGGQMPEVWVTALHDYFQFEWHQPRSGVVDGPNRQVADDAASLVTPITESSIVQGGGKQTTMPQPAQETMLASVRRRPSPELDYGADLPPALI